MLALRRSDVADLNQLARSLMDTAGRLGKERLVVAEREFAAGDRVVCLRNSDVLGVKNGTRGTVERIDSERRTLVVATDRGPIVELSRSYLETGNVRHAYALTGHAAQGLTVERAFVLGSGEARLQEWGYVALSRARAETRLYVTGTPREHESHFHDLDDRDPLTRFGRALEESAIEELAVDQHPLPSGPRHDARPEIERSDLTADERMRRRLLEQKRRALAEDDSKRPNESSNKLSATSPGAALSAAERGTSYAGRRELQRRAIAMTRQQLAETDTQIDESRLTRTDRAASVQQTDACSRTRSREMAARNREVAVSRHPAGPSARSDRAQPLNVARWSASQGGIECCGCLLRARLRL